RRRAHRAVVDADLEARDLRGGGMDRELPQARLERSHVLASKITALRLGGAIGPRRSGRELRPRGGRSTLALMADRQKEQRPERRIDLLAVLELRARAVDVPCLEPLLRVAEERLGDPFVGRALSGRGRRAGENGECSDGAIRTER